VSSPTTSKLADTSDVEKNQQNGRTTVQKQTSGFKPRTPETNTRLFALMA
jgi:hypothetical protein